MAIQTVNIGSYANDGTGDDLRTAFEKVNYNFALLDSVAAISNGANLGSGAGIFASKNSATLQFKSLTSDDGTVTITSSENSIDLKSSPNIVDDSSPQLGGDLDLNDHYIYNGDVRTTVFGYDIPNMFGLFNLLIGANQIDIDLGTFTVPNSGNLDMNGTGNINFIDSATSNTELDFGSFV